MARVAVVLKGYPRLSETFIAQEIRALEARGLDTLIVSLRHPTERARHPVHGEIRASVLYLPEYLYQEPGRVLCAYAALRRTPGYAAARALWLCDLRRDPTPNRGRRFGQALVLAHELPATIQHLHVHFLHTPASVARYAARIRGLTWSVSAHAKDIWTTPDWEIREKLAACAWAVTCTAAGQAHLAARAPVGRVALVHHGIDAGRFPPPPLRQSRPDGRDPAQPVVILSVGRAVEKKGTADLLAALARLPANLAWRLVHIGGGPLLSSLRRRAADLGLADRITWMSARPQGEVLAAYRAADVFALASRIARDGDRDGLPNVLVEAASQGLACVATWAGAIPELIEDGRSGLLVKPGDADALAQALAALIRDPARRRALGAAAAARVGRDFAFAAGIDRLAPRFGLPACDRRAAE
ncbi:MAG: colanic acid biosynthesis glycosyltransferase WcaL [Alphaproteobacteria bacterium]|nr:colanic acid biosynthesis glycosyltransferase WcaL [Alphaproteobacteria bacterium]